MAKHSTYIRKYFVEIQTASKKLHNLACFAAKLWNTQRAVKDRMTRTPHTIILEYVDIAHGADLTSSKLLTLVVKAKLVYAFTHLPATFPAIEQFNTASAFVEIVPLRHCIAIMQYLTVAFP